MLPGMLRRSATTCGAARLRQALRGVCTGERTSPTCSPMKLGDVYEMERTFSAADVRAYAELGGDTNPIHTSPEAAKATNNLPACVVHGMLYAGLFPAIIGNRQPGAMYLKQTLQFRQPVLVGEKVRAVVKVERLSSRRAVLNTTCYKVCREKGSEVLVLDGDALALLPAAERALEHL